MTPAQNNSLSELSGAESEYLPEKKTVPDLQDAKDFYASVTLPSGWRETVDPEKYLRSRGKFEYESYPDRTSWQNWQNLIGHLLSWSLLLFIAFGIHLLGIHRWSLTDAIIGKPARSIVADLTADTETIPSELVPSAFVETVKEINRAIKDKKWGQAEKLTEHILSSDAIGNEANFYRNLRYLSVKLLVSAGKYDQAWGRFLDLKQQSQDFLPYPVIYAAVRARYEIATRGSLGNGMPVRDAEKLIDIMTGLRADYALEMNADKGMLLFEADSFLSSLGRDKDTFDLREQANVAIWEQFESLSDRLLKLDNDSRSALCLQYRKWQKIENFFWIPFSDEQIVIGRYAYKEAFVRKMKEDILKKMR